MKKMMHGTPPTPPHRRELEENPVLLCHDVTRLSRAKARETNIDGIMSQPGARLVLSHLATCDGISQRYLVERTHLRAPTVSVILRKMEEEGMVEILQSPEDRREKRVHITDYGRQVDMKGIAKIKETDAMALKGLSEDEIETLMSLLGRMRENLLDVLPECRRDEKREKGEG